MRQPYESLFLRIVAACSGALLFLPIISRDSSSYRGAWLYSAVCWLVMPVFFFWMYWMNGGNAVWLASISAMFLIYYHMTDWRLATVGSTTGALLSWLVFNALRAPVEASASFSIENLVVIGFAWGTAFVLGFSSANLRRTRLINTLSTMAVMAHELRTPLATVDLLGDVLRNQAPQEMPEHKHKNIQDRATRLQNLVRSM
ncbi:MAG: sensor histidine kinase, partial [Hydrogenophaga sp.]|nr:sensor histidine kinase [Hydrogenophaga sp.]